MSSIRIVVTINDKTYSVHELTWKDNTVGKARFSRFIAKVVESIKAICFSEI